MGMGAGFVWPKTRIMIDHGEYMTQGCTNPRC